MKPMVKIFTAALAGVFAVMLTALLAGGCARPAYVAKSDVRQACMRGEVARVDESCFSNPPEMADPAAVPDTTEMMLDTHTVVEYNRAGNITREEVFVGPERTHSTTEEYSYDHSGTRIERSVSRNRVRHTFSAQIYTYDDAGRLIAHANEMWPASRTEFTHDRHEYPRTETVYTQEDRLSLKVRHRYNRHGQLRVTRAVRGSDPAIRYEYQPSGVVARVRTGRRTVDTFDDSGNLISAATVITRTREGKNGRLKVIGREPLVITADYEYDAQGNWTHRVQRYNGRVLSVAVRRIDYRQAGQ